MAQNLQAVLKALVKDLDASYTEALKFQDPLNTEEATGVWLDYIAGIVGEDPRPWDPDTNKPLVDDVEYRKRINVKIQLNSGSGTIEDVIMAVRRYALMGTQDWDDVKDIQFPIVEGAASLYIDVLGGDIGDAYRVKQYLSAGVGLHLTSHVTGAFAFSSLDPSYDPGTTDKGFSNLPSPTDGGSLRFFLF